MAEKAVGDGVRRRSVESKAKKERDTSSVFDSSLVEGDLQNIRSEVTTYVHSQADTAILNKAIAPIPPMQRLPPLLRRLTVECFKKVEIPTGRVVITAGDAADSLCVVGSGTFNLNSPEVNEGRSSLGRYSKGGIISERVLYFPSVGRTPFSVTCEEAGVLFVLPKAAFFTVKKHVDDGIGVAGGVSEFLSGLPSCADMTEDQLKLLAMKAKARVRTKGSAIISKEEESDGILIVQTGSINVLLPRPGGSASSGECLEDDAPQITFVAGDVVGEKQLAEMSNGSLEASVNCSYLRISKANSIIAPERMRWMAETHTLFKIFKSMDVFAILAAEQIETLVRAAKYAKFQAGETVSTRGSTGPSPLWIVINGFVTVSRPDPKDEAKSEVLGRLGTAEHFGAKNIVDSSAPREVEVVADSSLTCLTLDTASFGNLLELVQHSLARELATRRWVLENRNKVAMGDLDAVRTIGVGTFGRVKLVVHKPTGKPYAVKQLKKKQLVEMNQVSNVKSEQTLLSTCSHPFLLKLAAAFQDKDCLFMVLEFIQGGELYRLMQDQEDGTLSLDMSRFYTASIVAAFAYLNSLNIIYRDLKPENILLSSDGTLKVIDFGFAKILTLEKTFTFCGTPDYMAPEIICHRGYALSCDWWSLGVFLFEMITGLPPFEAFEDPSGIDTFGKVLEYVAGKTKIEYPEGMDANAIDIINHLCDPDDKKRYRSEKAMAHPFFASIDFMALEKGQVTPPFVPPVKDATDASNFDEMDEEDDDEDDAEAYAHIPVPEPTTFGRFAILKEGEQPRSRQKSAAPDPPSTSEPAVEPGGVVVKMDAISGSGIVRADGSSHKGARRAKEMQPPTNSGGCCVLQ